MDDEGKMCERGRIEWRWWRWGENRGNLGNKWGRENIRVENVWIGGERVDRLVNRWRRRVIEWNRGRWDFDGDMDEVGDFE